jgi:hypothetical protein
MTFPKTRTTEVAVPLPDDSEVRAVIGDSYDPEGTFNVVKMFAGTGDLGAAFIGLIRAVFSAEGIDNKHREMIVLRSAKVLNAPYAWHGNVPLAENAGLTDKEIAAAGSDGPVSGVDPEYVLICSATDELSLDGTLKDASLSQLIDSFGVVLTRKYIATIAWFNLACRFINGCRVPIETHEIGGNTSPIG